MRPHFVADVAQHQQLSQIMGMMTYHIKDEIREQFNLVIGDLLSTFIASAGLKHPHCFSYVSFSWLSAGTHVLQENDGPTLPLCTCTLVPPFLLQT